MLGSEFKMVKCFREQLQWKYGSGDEKSNTNRSRPALSWRKITGYSGSVTTRRKKPFLLWGNVAGLWLPDVPQGPDTTTLSGHKKAASTMLLLQDFSKQEVDAYSSPLCCQHQVPMWQTYHVIAQPSWLTCNVDWPLISLVQTLGDGSLLNLSLYVFYRVHIIVAPLETSSDVYSIS